MKQIIFIIFILSVMMIAPETATAQVTKKSAMPQKAQLWLNDGRTVRGTVKEFVSGESVTLADGDSVLTTYAWSDIKKIKRVHGYGFNSFTGEFEPYASWQCGFHGIADYQEVVIRLHSICLLYAMRQ